MNRLPRPRSGCDIKSLPLQPAEAFLLSRVDGSLDERELALVTGLPPDAVARALDRLSELGAISLDAGGTGKIPASPRSSRSAVAISGRADDAMKVPAELRPTNPTPGGTFAVRGRLVSERASDSPPLYDPAELDEPVEIDAERRRKILDLYYRLDDLSYYELLAVAEDADKKQIKSAYYLAAPEFHPDKFFRKNLGSYRAKIEAIFSRLTLAHDVLTSKEKRPEYDAYLEQTHRNRSMAAALEHSAREVAAVVSAVEEAAKALAGGAPSSDAPRTDARSASMSTAPAASVVDTPGRYHVESDADALRARREAFARKLKGGTLRPPPTRPSSAPPDDPPRSAETRAADARAAADALRARYEAAKSEATRQQVQRYVGAAKGALDRKDYASAANAYRIAASLAPTDDELQRTCAQVAQLAAAALAEGFLRQAQYEAANARWSEAALSFTKVCNGRPDDPRAHERVAYATLMSSGNARRAVEFARRAVELAPKTPDLRVTLAHAYIAAGLEKSARAEADRAMQLAPGDARIKDLVEKLPK